MHAHCWLARDRACRASCPRPPANSGRAHHRTNAMPAPHPWKSSGGVATVPAASLFAFLPSQTACQRSGRPVRTAPGWPRPNHPSTRAHCTDPLSLLSPLPHHAGTPLPTPCQPPLSRQANVSLAWEGRRRGGGGGAWGVRVEREEKRQENRRSFLCRRLPHFFLASHL
jgi:hypothetical protein